MTAIYTKNQKKKAAIYVLSYHLFNTLFVTFALNWFCSQATMDLDSDSSITSRNYLYDNYLYDSLDLAIYVQFHAISRKTQ